MKKEETNDIVQNLYDALFDIGIDKKFCKQDVTTKKSLSQRGDVWVSLSENSKKDFEKDIIALIEAKHKKCVIGDIEWQDAMTQGKEKALKQGLSYYVVTNCVDLIRFYNAKTDELITLDGELINKFQPIKTLIQIQTQTNESNSNIISSIRNDKTTTEKDFQRSLDRLREIFRAAAVKDSNEKINTIVTFIILKYICEMEEQERSLSNVVRLWNDYGQNENYKSDIDSSLRDILSGDYGKKYIDFKNIVDISSKLNNNHYARIHSEIDKYHFHGCGFDIYGAIYEEFASPKEKKEFGEFYTRRHITGVISRLLLRNEQRPRDLKICDPACGTGGFLTEAFKVLKDNYAKNHSLNDKIVEKLQNEVFYGYDNQTDSIQRTMLNMFLAGDGHTHIKEKDSLADLEKDTFDYIVANPPYGLYDGDIKIENFTFTNQRRFELLFLERIINAVKDGGEMAIVVPDGVLETPTNEEFRKKLLQHCTVHAVVSLTRFAFAPYTKEKTYVLFMQKKQKADIGKIQTEPIWHFILDHDGFANSDKRFLTPKHNDIALLEETFLKGKKSGKYGFVEMKDVNNDNFHNLLSEFYLRPVIVETKTIGEFNDSFDELMEKLKKLIKKADEVRENIKNNHTISKVDVVERDVTLSRALKLLPKNSGITEEFIYLNEDPDKEQIPIYTSSYEILGYLPEGTLKDGQPVTVNSGKSVIVFRKGKAGTMFYVNDDKYIACENAIPFQISEEYKNKIDIKWFYFTYRKIFLNLVTSKADNATFNLDFLDRLTIDIPKLDLQKRIIEKYEMLEDLEKDILDVAQKLKEIEFISLKEG
jgi:type I restriction-modification system DNA methylase subunit